jgi:hypothetical protein
MSGAEEVRRLARQLRAQLAGFQGDPLESSGLRVALRDRLTVEQARTRMTELGLESAAPSVAPSVAAADVTAAAVRAMGKVDTGRESNLTDFELVSLEAIVQLTGRPAMRFTDGRVGMPATDLGENDRWRTLVAIARSTINRASASVGQVAIGGGGGTEAIGTAWRLGADLVVTNRHVAAELVADKSIPPAQWSLAPAKLSIVDFNVTDAATTTKRFRIAALLYCAPEADVDLALLRLDGGGEALPAPLTLDFAADSVGRSIDSGGTTVFQGEEVYVVGHPLRRLPSSESAAVFGNADGFKRCSPGVVTAIPTRPHAFEHDCSTLGGNSGSCVLSVSGHRVVGLHYGGADVNEATGMGRANLALGLARLRGHPAAAMLEEGRVP